MTAPRSAMRSKPVDNSPIAVALDQARDDQSRALAGSAGTVGHAQSLGKDPGDAGAGLLRNNGVVKIARVQAHADAEPRLAQP